MRVALPVPVVFCSTIACCETDPVEPVLPELPDFPVVVTKDGVPVPLKPKPAITAPEGAVIPAESAAEAKYDDTGALPVSGASDIVKPEAGCVEHVNT